MIPRSFPSAPEWMLVPFIKSGNVRGRTGFVWGTGEMMSSFLDILIFFSVYGIFRGRSLSATPSRYL